MDKIYDSFHRDYRCDEDEPMPDTVPVLEPHEFLRMVAEDIQMNGSSEDIDLYQPKVLKHCAEPLWQYADLQK